MSAHIVIIDPSTDMLDVFRMALEAENYIVTISPSLCSNLAASKPPIPDLFILDIGFGAKYHHWDSFLSLKAYPPTSTVPILLTTTALEEILFSNKSLLPDFDAILFKPFDIDDLLSSIQHLLLTPS